MNTTGFVCLGLGVLALGAVAYVLATRKRSEVRKSAPFQLVSETLDGVLHFPDIVAFFQGLKLEKGRHIPFMAQGTGLLKFGRIDIPEKEGYIPIFLGVYDEVTECIISHRLIYATEIDARTKEVLGDEQLIVLE